MISKRTWAFGAALLVVAAVFVSGLLSRRANCGPTAIARSTRNAILRVEGSHSEVCGVLDAPEMQPLLIGLIFFGLVGVIGSWSSDMRAWRNAGQDD